jgi:hypothetical protein
MLRKRVARGKPDRLMAEAPLGLRNMNNMQKKMPQRGQLLIDGTHGKDYVTASEVYGAWQGISFLSSILRKRYT